MDSPRPGANTCTNGGNGGLGSQNGKREYPSRSPSDFGAKLVARLTSASCYGGNDQMNPYPSYEPHMGRTNDVTHYQQPNGARYAGLNSAFYPYNNVHDIQSTDTRRRAIDALDNFLDDIKRRASGPSAYYDCCRRLQSNPQPLPVAPGSGKTNGYNNRFSSYGDLGTASLIDAFSDRGYNVNGGAGGGNRSGANADGSMAQHGYHLPLPNARFKGDFQDIDRSFEQL